MQVISISNQYASGLRRLVAAWIDWFAISILLSIVFRYVFGWDWDDDTFGIFYIDIYSWHWWMRELLVVIYFALMESSTYQGTFGKIALGIRVVGKNNERISLPNAILRNLSKIISVSILCIGYIMIIFDQRKQGLHDKIADTFVLKV